MNVNVKLSRAMVDPSAGASMKSVEQSDIGNGDTQVYANRRYSNSYGRKSAHRAEQALQGYAERIAGCQNIWLPARCETTGRT